MEAQNPEKNLESKTEKDTDKKSGKKSAKSTSKTAVKKEEAVQLPGVTADITTVDEITRKAVISVDAANIDGEYKSGLKRYVGRAKINGFRPGKAPVEIVEKMYGESLRWDAVSKSVSDTLQKVIQNNELQMVGSPKIDITTNVPGSALEFTAEFCIYPTPSITGYEKLSVEVEKEEVTEEAVERIITSIRRSKAVTTPTDRTMVETDDVIDVSVVFKAQDGSETSSETATIGLGDGRLPKEFDEQVIGMQIGETRDVSLASGEEGGQLTYSVTLNKINQRVLPELTDEFVASLGEEDKTVETLKARIKKNLETQHEAQAKEKAKTVLVEKLIELNPFQIPQSMTDDEIRNLLIRVGAVDASKTKFEEVPAEPFRDSFGEMAAKRVKANIVLDQVAQKENITPNDEDLKKAFQEIAFNNRISEEQARKQFTGRSMLHLAVEITRSKTQDLLIEKADIKYVPKGN